MVCAPRLQHVHHLLAAGLRPWGQGLTLATLLWLSGPALAQTALPDLAPTAAPTVNGGRIVRPTLRLGSQGESVRELQSMLVLLGFYPGPVSGIYQEETQTAVQRFQRAAAITADGIVGPATWSQLFPAPAAEASPPNLVSNTTPPATTPPATTPPAATPPATTPPTTTPPTTTPPATTPPATTPPATTPPTTTPPATTPGNGRPATTSPAQPATASLPILRPGMEGDAVRLLQRRLAAKNMYRGPIDGIFGSQTEAAVRQLQQANSLTVDGIVGPATWGALN